MEPTILLEARQWVEWDFNAVTKTAVEAAIASEDNEALSKMFSARMAFGTAGLRAEMGPGISRMNDLTVVQAAQGLIAYLLEVHGDILLKFCTNFKLDN
jgi:hypothetical protein